MFLLTPDNALFTPVTYLYTFCNTPLCCSLAIYHKSLCKTEQSHFYGI